MKEAISSIKYELSYLELDLVFIIEELFTTINLIKEKK